MRLRADRPELALRVKETARAFVKQVGERDRVIVGPVEGPRTDGTGQPAVPEGFVCRFRGPGVVYIQSRNPGSFGAWVRQFIPVSE